MPFGVSSGIQNVIIHAKFHVDRLRGFWATGPLKVPFPILIGTTLTTVLHYRADCDEMTSVHLARSHCLPLLLYSCEIWSIRSDDVSSLIVAWNNAFRKIFNSCWIHSVKPLQFYCGCLPVSFLIRQRRCRLLFWRKLVVSDNIALQSLVVCCN